MTAEKYIGALERKDFIKQGLYANALRGMHSTGVAMVPHAGKKMKGVLVQKRAWPSSVFVTNAQTDFIFNDIGRFKYAIGHNRQATVGDAKNPANAHPFKHGKIVLAHNGTLYNYHGIKHDKDFGTDSEHLAYSVDKIGIKDTIKEIEGAFALSWYDHSDGTMNLARNGERELYFTTLKNDTTVLYGSEAGMLEWLAYRNKMDVKETFYVQAWTALKFNPDDPSDYESINLPKYVRPARGNSKRTINTILADAGLRLNQRLAFRIFDQKVSTVDKKKCTVYGITDDDSGHSVRMHRVPSIEYEFDELYSGKIFNVIWCPDERDWVMVLDDLQEEPDQTEAMGDEDKHIAALVKRNENREVSQEESPFTPQERKEAETLIDSRDTPLLTLIMNHSEENLEDESLREKLLENRLDAKEVRGPGRLLISLRSFNDLTKRGCARCTSDIFPLHQDYVVWTHDNQPICPACSIHFPELADHTVRKNLH